MQKSQANTITRFRRLERERRSLVVEAAFTLAWVSAALRLLRFRRAIRLGSMMIPPASEPRTAARDCVWAVEAAARRLPWRSVCIQKGIALQRMLRRRGVDACLHYGARRDEDSGRLEAHVWVTVAGEALIGGEEAAGFAEVAAYP